MLGKRGLTGLACAVVLWLCAPSAHAADFTEVRTCEGAEFEERCETVLDVPAGVPGLVTGIVPPGLVTCLAPVNFPIEGVGEIATCEPDDSFGVTHLRVSALDEEVGVETKHLGNVFELAVRNGGHDDPSRTRIVVLTGTR